MSHAERGLYILALCLQWTQGSVTRDEIANLGKAMAQPSLCRVISKFDKGDDGRLRNARLEFERAKQSEYRKNRRESGKSGAEKRWHSHSTANRQPIANDSSPSPSPSPSPVLAVRESTRHFPEHNGRMTLQEVKDTAQLIGLAEWRAVDFFNEMEGCGWLDHNSRPIQNGKAVLARVKSKWEADGRPDGPPAGQFSRAKEKTKSDHKEIQETIHVKSL